MVAIIFASELLDGVTDFGVPVNVGEAIFAFLASSVATAAVVGRFVLVVLLKLVSTPFAAAAPAV